MFRVKIEGLDLTQAQLALLKEDIAGLEDAWEKISKLAASRVAAPAPVRSGKLRASVDSKADRQYATASAGSDLVPYAGMVNYRYGKRFMKKAEIDILPMIEPILEAEIGKIIKKRGF